MRRLTVVTLMILVILTLAHPQILAGPRIESEEDIVGKVRVICDLAGVTVTIAGFTFKTKAGKAMIIGDVPVGEHLVTASMEGFQDWQGKVKVAPNAMVQLSIKMGPAEAAAGPAGGKPKLEETISVKPSAGEAQKERPAAETPPALTQDQVQAKVADLLAKAEEDLKALRLTTPSPGNAWDKYTEILALDPDNREAKKGLERIVGSYVEMAAKAMADDDLVKAEAYLDKAEKVIAGDPKVAQVRGEISARKTAKEEVKEEQKVEEVKPALPQTVINTVGMKLVLCPAGEFPMGTKADQGFADERPLRRVTISKPFYIGAYEVTQLEFQRVMGENPSRFRETASDFQAKLQRPVEQVDWTTAAKFCTRLSALESRTYRLPTEAEWEYACRAGGEPLESIGVRGSETMPVGQISNPWGLWDMQGNVWEWCADFYDPDFYSQGKNVDPTGPEKGKDRVARGGCFNSDQHEPGSTRSNQRNHLPDFTREPTLGFRVVLVP